MTEMNYKYTATSEEGLGLDHSGSVVKPEKGWKPLRDIEGYEAKISKGHLMLRRIGKLYPCVERQGRYMINGVSWRTVDILKMLKAPKKEGTLALSVFYKGVRYYVGRFPRERYQVERRLFLEKIKGEVQ